MQMEKKKKEKKKTSLTLESNIKTIKTSAEKKKIILVIMQKAGGSITDAQCQIEENAVKNANCRCLESGSR